MRDNSKLAHIHWIEISLKRIALWIKRDLPLHLRPCIPYTSWWRHQMETFSALLALCVGNSPVTGEFPSQRPVTRSFGVFFDLRMNKQLSKQSRRRWFENHRANYDTTVMWMIHICIWHHCSPIKSSTQYYQLSVRHITKRFLIKYT